MMFLRLSLVFLVIRGSTLGSKIKTWLRIYRSPWFTAFQLAQVSPDQKDLPDCSLQKSLASLENMATVVGTVDDIKKPLRVCSLERKMIGGKEIPPEAVFDSTKLSREIDQNLIVSPNVLKRTSLYGLPDLSHLSANVTGYFRVEDAMRRNLDSLLRYFPPEIESWIPLNFQHIVPGGRFQEMYYWDTYFSFVYYYNDWRRTASKRSLNIALGMVENIAFLIRSLHYVPSGNRFYYLGRSQPPMFCLMIDEIIQDTPEAAIIYTDALETEWKWWTKSRNVSFTGLSSEKEGSGPKTPARVYTYNNDVNAFPRPESLFHDMVTTSMIPDLEPWRVYQEIKATTESGWDFSSRFAKQCGASNCYVTTEIAAVDLNALIWKMEEVLAKLFDLTRDFDTGSRYRDLARQHRKDFNEIFYDSATHSFRDLNWQQGNARPLFSAASVMPLVTGVADEEKAKRTLFAVEEQLLTNCGITPLSAQDSPLQFRTDRQWDYPNGWAPLQYLAVRASLNYKNFDLARNISKAWTLMVLDVAQRTDHTFEKYNLETCDGERNKIGEYSTQTDFAWTAAVTLEFLAQQTQSPVPTI